MRFFSRNIIGSFVCFSFLPLDGVFRAICFQLKYSHVLIDLSAYQFLAGALGYKMTKRYFLKSTS